MSRELIQRIISEETREIGRVGRQLFSEDPNTQSEALAQIVLIRESIIKLLGMLGTPRA